MSGEQLSLEDAVDVPGYYSTWAETRNRYSGTGSTRWYPSAAAARAGVVAQFDRGYRNWPEDRRPKAEVVKVELLLPGEYRGEWRDIPADERPRHRDWPWFPDRAKETA